MLRSCALVLYLVVCALCHTIPIGVEQIHVDQVRFAVDNAVTLSASPALLQTSGQWVEVSWTGVDNPRDDDWIGVYAQTPFNVTETTPSKYQFCNRSETHKIKGAGSLRFRLVNMRAPTTFVLFRGGVEKPVYSQKSNPVAFANYNEVLQLHLSITDDPSEMVISWASLNSSAPVCKFGTTSQTYITTVSANSSTYTKDMMCGAPATTVGWTEPGTLHSAVLHGLKPEVQYFYICGDEATGFSKERTFRGSPATGRTSNFSMIAYGDMGKGEADGSKEIYLMQASLNTTTRVAAEVSEHDLVLHIGDLSYARGYASQWDEFMDQVQPIASAVPYMTCIGNHERDFPNSGSFYNGTDSGGECGVPYEFRFPLPDVTRDAPWYSFDFGAVHFTVMSSEHDFMPGSPQWAFLAADVTSVDRSITPWLIFTGHRPMYLDSDNEDNFQTTAAQLRDALESLLMKAEVDLCLWGHHHSYQRSCPVYKQVCVRDKEDGSAGAPVHAVIGMAGAGLFHDILHDQPVWTKFLDTHNWGFTRLNVAETELTLEFVANADGAVHDSFTLKKPATN